MTMTNGKGDFGTINVEMGDGNEVGHIGHKITFHEPPPPPNGLYQNGKLTGEFEGQPAHGDGCYNFSKLFVGPDFDASCHFEIQGVKLLIEGIQAETAVSLGGRLPLRTLWGVVCRIG